MKVVVNYARSKDPAEEVVAKLSEVIVNAICPDFIETDMFSGMPKEAQERIPLRRLGTPHEIARTVRYLVIDGDYVTCQTINVNGGIYK